MLDYQKINYKYWNRVYSAENVEGYIFRLKPKLLDFYINSKKKIDSFGLWIKKIFLMLI